MDIIKLAAILLFKKDSCDYTGRVVETKGDRLATKLYNGIERKGNQS